MNEVCDWFAPTEFGGDTCKTCGLDIRSHSPNAPERTISEQMVEHYAHEFEGGDKTDDTAERPLATAGEGEQGGKADGSDGAAVNPATLPACTCPNWPHEVDEECVNPCECDDGGACSTCRSHMDQYNLPASGVEPEPLWLVSTPHKWSAGPSVVRDPSVVEEYRRRDTGPGTENHYRIEGPLYRSPPPDATEARRRTCAVCYHEKDACSHCDTKALVEALRDQIRATCFAKVQRTDAVAVIEARGDLMEYACPKAVTALREHEGER